MASYRLFQVISFLIFCVLTLNGNSAIITSNGSGLWSNGGTWVGGVVPVAGDDVRIGNGHTVTVNNNFICNSLQIGVATVNLNTSVNINTGFTLTVNGGITFITTATNGVNLILNAGDGFVTCTGVTMPNTGNDSRDCIIQINTGSVTVAGTLSCSGNAARNHIDFSGNGNFIISGDLTGTGAFVPNNFGTVNLNGTNQTIAATYNSYHNLTCSNSGTKTISAATTLSGNLSINGTAALDVTTSNYNLTVGGNWSVTSTNADPFVERNARVTFNGSTGVQTISTVLAGGESFYNLTIANSSSADPALQTSVNLAINNDYDHSSGVLNLNGNAFSVINSSNQTYSLTGGGIISSTPGSLFTVNTNGTNTITINFFDFFVGRTTSQEITINVSTTNSYYTNSIFYGPMEVTKLGSGGNDCDGGNIFYGPITFNTIAGGDRWRMGHVNGDVFYNLTVNHNGNSNFIFGRQATGNQYHGTTTLNSSTSGGVFIGRNNGAAGIYTHEFFGPVIVNVTLTGNVYFSDADATRIQNCTFHSTIELNSAATSTGDIYFGNSNNGATLTLSNTAQFIGGTVLGATRIRMYSLTQNGNLTQTISTAGTSDVIIGSNQVADACVFNGPVNINCPTIDFRRNTFNNTFTAEAQSILFQRNTFGGATQITKTTGATSNNTNGENVFNSDATFIHNGTGTWYLGASPSGDDFNGNASFLRMNSGTLNPSATNNSTFAGDITTTGSTNQVSIATITTGRAILDGSANQRISGDFALNPIFGRMSVDKSGGSVILDVPINISNNLDLVSRNIISTSVNLVIINHGSTVTSTSNSSFVNGPVRKVGNADFTFPTGKNGFYAPIGMEISGASNSAHHFTAEYFNTDPDGSYNTSLKDPVLDHISRCEYWNLDRTNGTTNVFVILSWDSRSCGVTNLSELRVARWDGALWANHGNSATTGTTASGTIRTSAAVTSFSPFTLASITTNNPLPIELLSFRAEKNNSSVDLFWTTASETNNDYFTVERSLDGIHFETVGTVQGAGFSNVTLNYFLKDLSPYSGVSYYRLKQTDFDGNFKYSELVNVNFSTNEKPNFILYPNPSTSGFQILLNDFKGGTIQLEITDINGKIIYRSDYNLSDINSKIISIDPSVLNSAGIYFINVMSSNGNQIEKLIVSPN